MFQNYFKIAIRSLWKNKAFSAINIVGLSASMAVCLLIILMLRDQYSFDTYNRQKERVFRIITHHKTQGGQITPFATAPANLAEQLKRESTWAEKVAIIRRAGITVNTGTESIDLSGFYANTDFFAVFDKKLSAGNTSTALAEPNTIVLTDETAKRLFGTKNPIGEILTLEDWEGKPIGQLTVTGVLDKQTPRSHLVYETLISFPTLSSLTQREEYIDLDNWFNLSEFWVYTLLKPQYDLSVVQTSLDNIAQTSCQGVGQTDLSFSPQALRAINPAKISIANSPRPALPIWIMYFFGGLAAIVLLLACFNYVSLSLARSLQRAKEIGIRKVVGAFRWQIMGQFLAESVVVALLALMVALGFLQVLVPAFNKLDEEVKDIFHFKFDATIFVWFVVFAIGTGLLAGLFPALVLSRFQPVATLRKLANLKVFSQITIRKALIVLQFAVSLIFIITLVTLNRQFHYTMQADLGYQTENILHINLQNHPYQQFQQMISSYKDVAAVSASSMILATNTGMSFRVTKTEDKDSLDLSYIAVDQHFIPVTDLKLLAGRNFNAVDSIHTEKNIILNETAVKALQFQTPQQAIGQILTFPPGRSVEVIGVVADFAYMNLQNTMPPVALRNVANGFNYVSVRLTGFETPAALKYFETAWKKIDPQRAFKYQFHDEALAYANADLTLTGKIIGVVGGIAIIIACMGLLGMVIYTTEARRKEVSIRKLLGAKVSNLVLLLSRSFLLLMLLAILIGSPAAYLINNAWLQNYTYRIELGIGIFGFSSLLLLVIALITIGTQVFRAATAKPVKYLKAE